MELQENILINLINARKFAPISINPICIEDPVQTDESSDEKQSLQHLFCELLKRHPQPLIFNSQPIKSNHGDLKHTKTFEICSLIKNECQMNRIPIEAVKRLRIAKNNLLSIKQIIQELEDNENLIYIVQKLNYIANTPEYDICSLGLASSLAVEIFTGFKLGDEKILKCIIDIAPQLE
ncbi:Hypothetical_protein [Hexamita inflata]|uniref:Hypothetical_protein n=1 Tax=Hexamita inflata TaxID=28002 RepID=A0ABP1KPU1_9EUKA